MKVADIMRTDVVTVNPSTPLRKVNELFHRFDTQFVVVTEGRAVKGIMTYADLFRQILPSYDEVMRDESYWLNAQITEERLSEVVKKPVGEAMSRSVLTVPPDMEAVWAGGLMNAKKIKQLPVIENGLLIGTVSYIDITWAFLMKPLF